MLKVTLTAEETVRLRLPAGEYSVKFFHGHDDSPERLGQRFTQCSVSWLREKGDAGMAAGVGGSDVLGMVSARVICHPEDTPNGGVGEMRALDKVLHHMWPDVREDWMEMRVDEVNTRQKATRTKFWDAYWDRFKPRKAPTLREKLVERADDYCQCPAGKTPCECGEELCMVCEMLHDVLGQGVLPDHKIDCAECGFPACSKREARYHPRKKEVVEPEDLDTLGPIPTNNEVVVRTAGNAPSERIPFEEAEWIKTGQVSVKRGTLTVERAIEMWPHKEAEIRAAAKGAVGDKCSRCAGCGKVCAEGKQETPLTVAQECAGMPNCNMAPFFILNPPRNCPDCDGTGKKETSNE